MVKSTVKTKYLVIGNSAGGIGAVEAIREVDKSGAITIVSDEPYAAYSRPLISEYLAGERILDGMLYRPADFYNKNSILTALGSRVKRLHLDEHIIELEGGKKIAWEKLLLATGGSPIVPQIEGGEKKGVFTFTTLDDAKAIDMYLNSSGATQAVVIGGGLIGISVTEALVKRQIKVTVVEMKERVLNTILDEEGSALEEEALKKAGVEVVAGHTVTAINGNSSEKGSINEVTLDDGNAISCNLVIIAIGVVPRTELVSNTEINVNRGIVVDRYMATSSRDIYACGDVAEAYDFIYGENRLTPIWPNAYLGGRVAGYNMAGILTEYPGGTAMNSLKYFKLDIAAAGIVDPLDNSYEVLNEKSDSAYHRVVLKDGLVVGMVSVGNIERSGIVFSLIKDKINVSSFKQALTADDFGLASLPRELWQKRLGAPQKSVFQPILSAERVEDPAGE